MVGESFIAVSRNSLSACFFCTPKGGFMRTTSVLVVIVRASLQRKFAVSFFPSFFSRNLWFSFASWSASSSMSTSVASFAPNRRLPSPNIPFPHPRSRIVLFLMFPSRYACHKIFAASVEGVGYCSSAALGLEKFLKKERVSASVVWFFIVFFS